MSAIHMRGLTQFIGDIRNCANKEEERKRVDKEMANIRKHFKAATKLTPCVSVAPCCSSVRASEDQR